MRSIHHAPFVVTALAWIAAVSFSCHEARADFIALGRTDTASPQGQQNFGGSLGEDFLVGNEAIRVTQLGVFDSGGIAIPADQPIRVEIFDNSGTNPLVVGPVSISSSTPGVSAVTDGYVYLPISPVTLQANHSYRLVAFGFNNTNENGNYNSGDPTPVGDVDTSGLISFPTTASGDFNGNPSASTNSYYNVISGNYPTTGDASNTGVVLNLYSAGSFEFVPAPEPASLVALTGMALVGFIALARRRVC